MKKTRILIVAAVLLALLIPAAVQAAGTFYCSTLIASGGEGSFADPWACGTDAQFNDVIDTICTTHGGGVLFRIFDGSYVFYRFEIVNGVCTTTDTAEYAGSPPNTGFPLPLILAIAAGTGVLLLGAGLVLRQKRTASAA